MSLSSRLEYNNQPIIPLNELQLAARNRVLSKTQSGEYKYEEVPCFCGSTQGFELAKRDRYGLPVTTVLCMNCGILRTSPRLTAESTERFYKDDYRELYSGQFSPEKFFELDMARGKSLVSQMPSLMAQAQTIYDVGCGSGGTLVELKKLGKKVAGCDVDDRYMDMGRGHGVNIINGGVKELLAQTGGPADLVLLSHVAEHFLDLRAELEEVIEAVKPGGFLLVQVPGIRYISASPDYTGDILRYLQNAHTFHFSAASLSFVLRSVGMEVIITDEQSVAAAKRPRDWKPGAKNVAPPIGEALSILSNIADLEKNYIMTHVDEIQPAKVKEVEISDDEPWPLNTPASLRVLAWPQYDSVDDLHQLLMVSDPLFGNDDACLCLRYDSSVDIPFEQASANLTEAFETLNSDRNLNVLFIDDEIPTASLPALGRAITSALQVDHDLEGVRADFIKSLKAPVITGKPD